MFGFGASKKINEQTPLSLKPTAATLDDPKAVELYEHCVAWIQQPSASNAVKAALKTGAKLEVVWYRDAIYIMPGVSK